MTTAEQTSAHERNPESASAASAEPLIELRELRVGYGGTAILPPITATIRRGELWALVGRNGAGKTTLLRTILGLQPRIGGESVLPGPTRLGYVPQRERLASPIPARVIDIVRDGLDRGWSFLVPGMAWRERERVDRALRDADLAGLERQRFSELSEGQKQRVLMARVLVSDPDLFLLDEPTSAMDAEAERATYTRVDRLRSARDLGVLVVSHRLSVVASVATHVLMVDPDTVVAGPVSDALSNSAFVERFGEAFSNRDGETGSAHAEGAL